MPTRPTPPDILPLYDKVCIRREQDVTVAKYLDAKSRIFVPDHLRQKYISEMRLWTGHVVALGPGTHLQNGDLIKPTVREGDRVLFGRYAGQDVELDGTEYLFIYEKDILAIVSKALTPPRRRSAETPSRGDCGCQDK